MDAGEWDRRYAGQEMVWSAEPNRFVAAEFTGVPAGRALDLAAGEGRNALWLAGLGWRVTAVDFSEVAIDKGRRIAEEHDLDVEWVVADLMTYRPEGAYDVVVVAYLHLPPGTFEQVLRAAVQALRPGGVLFGVGHDLTNLTDGMGGPQDPEVLWTPERLTAALPGMTIDRAERVRRDGAIDTLVRATRV